MGRRADGELELEVLRVLWDAVHPLHTAEIQDLLRAELAYTSVATVLSRLVAKKLVRRAPTGRSFVYSATVTRDDWYAGRMLSVLRETSTHRSLLAGFVDKLSARDRAVLKRLLDDSNKQ